MKIAIAMSGETRSYNEFRGPDALIHKLEDMGHTVDIYGHTWKHCEIPDDADSFKNFIYEDQQVLDDWIKEDFMLRAWSNENWNPSCKLSEMSADDWVNKILAESRKKFGQHFGGLRCIHSVPTNEYDAIIRWRWDITFQDDSLNAPDYLKKGFFDYIERLPRKNDEGFPIMLAGCNSWSRAFERITFEDTHWIFNKSAHAKFVETATPEDKLDYVFKHGTPDGKMSYHTFWTELILLTDDIDISLALANVTCHTGWNGTPDPLCV